ncbi:MAG: 4Fe-4S binding protein [Actinobacteria bacterium]|nr:4Fe-4S binding protein [Actinomycetota bacterium]
MGRGRKSVAFFAKTSRFKNAMFKTLNVPVLGRLMKLSMDAKGTNFTYIPVYEGVETSEGTALPVSIVEHFINEACYHVILDYCLCRKGNDCQEYDIDIGCIFVGEGAREISPEVGRHVGREEALMHHRRAVAEGLIPVVGKVKIDAMGLGVKNYNRLMTICHCCPCCCLTGGIHYAPRDVREILVRLEGVKVEVTGDCNACGRCVDACIFKQIEIVDGIAVVGEECKGCSRCATACPVDAITITVDNPGYIDECIDRISAYVEVK